MSALAERIHPTNPAVWDIKTLEKEHWHCLKFPDNSIYYGEVAYFDEKGQETSASTDQDLLDQGKVKKMRHGFGVQIFQRSDQTILCKYEGYWVKDKKHGVGTTVFPDQSIYIGNLKNEVKDGEGKYIWASGDQYDGHWKEGKMDGNGVFLQKEGPGSQKFKGSFKNNYYHMGGGTYINPFDSLIEIQQQMTKTQEVLDRKKLRQAENLYFYEEASSMLAVRRLIKQSNANNRIPIILSTKGSTMKVPYQVFKSDIENPDEIYKAYLNPQEAPVNDECYTVLVIKILTRMIKAAQKEKQFPDFINESPESLSSKIGKNLSELEKNKNQKLFLAQNLKFMDKLQFSEFSLRDAKNLQRSNELQPYMIQVKQQLARTLCEGGLFILNVDDSKSEYREIYDPDFKEFYDREFFPRQVFHREDLQIREVVRPLLQGTQFEGKEDQLSQDFLIGIWTKMRIDDDTPQHKVRDKIEKRFGALFSLQELDVILITKFDL